MLLLNQKFRFAIFLQEIQKIFRQLRELGIGVNLHYIPVHTQPYYQAMGFTVGDYPAAEHYYQQAISLPLFHGMTHAQQDEVVAALHTVLLIDG